MPSTKTLARMAATFALIAMTAALPATAASVDLSNPAFAPVSSLTSIPIGHSEFCKQQPQECRSFDRVRDVEALTEDRWRQLVAINDRMNREIVPVTDADLYGVEELWTFPAGYGDCEDIALAKRQALIESGWDPSTLLMTVVRQQNGEGHAVLMARTDRGDLILDNQDGMIRLWSDTPYQYIKRQSQAHAAQWIDIVDARIVQVAAN